MLHKMKRLRWKCELRLTGQCFQLPSQEPHEHIMSLTSLDPRLCWFSTTFTSGNRSYNLRKLAECLTTRFSFHEKSTLFTHALAKSGGTSVDASRYVSRDDFRVSLCCYLSTILTSTSAGRQLHGVLRFEELAEGTCLMLSSHVEHDI